MINIGKYNDLHISRFCDMGAMLDGGEVGEVLLPKRYLKDWMEVGSLVHVIVYPDSEDKLVGTREKAYAQVGEFAFLQVELVNEAGAYLDWGVARRLFVPIREQKARMHEDGIYLVHLLYNDKNKRIFGTAKYDQYIDKGKPPYEVGDAVQILIASQTDLGFKAIIENKYIGMLYANELFDTLETGDVCTAYIKRIRDDYKIDLSLSKIGHAKVVDFAEELKLRLIERGGFMAINDNTDAETIYELFGVSKKTFKRALGELYRNRLVELTDEGIRMVSDE
jgi:predicted RNA-binding protein (virulence factor B family)